MALVNDRIRVRDRDERFSKSERLTVAVTIAVQILGSSWTFVDKPQNKAR